MGYNAGVLSLGTAGYPAIGGILATLGWHYPFLLPILALPLGLVILKHLKNPEPRNHQHLKEYLKETLRSIRSLPVVLMLVASVVTFIILYGTFLTYFPIYLGTVFGGSPLVIGLIMSMLSLATAYSSSQLGRLSRRLSKVTLIRLSFVLFGIALFLFPFMPDMWFLLLPTFLFGLAHGVNFPSIQTVLAESAPIQYRGAFMSVYGMVLRIGQTLGPLVMGLAYTGLGYSGVFFTGAALALATFGTLLMIKGENAAVKRMEQG